MDYFVKVYKDWKLHSQFQEIVPDMDDDYNTLNEKQSIRESARSLKKYGSTSYNMRSNEVVIRHEINKTDTLQGIALKYGCTTEQIRRANRLFASDSLFLRQYLLVPVEKSSEFFQSLDPTDSCDSPCPPALPSRPYSIAGIELLDKATADAKTRTNQKNKSSKQSKSLDSIVTMSPEEENRKCINDFLNKIDSTISESRKYVEKSKDIVMSQSDGNFFSTTDTRHRKYDNRLNNSYRNSDMHFQNHTRHSSTGSSSDTTHLLNTTQLRRVQNSLKKLEKEQDDFFEL